jgi:hypothetical protein
VEVTNKQSGLFHRKKAATEAKFIFAESRLRSDDYGLQGFPLFDNFAVARCPVSQIGEHGNAWLNVENQFLIAHFRN